MNKLAHKNISRFSFFLVLLYYFVISLFVESFHKPHEDPTKYHDDCPACNWERQSQDTHQTTSAAQVCQQIHQIFVRYIQTPDEQVNFQSFHFNNSLSRAPPSI